MSSVPDASMGEALRKAALNARIVPALLPYADRLSDACRRADLVPLSDRSALAGVNRRALRFMLISTADRFEDVRRMRDAGARVEQARDALAHLDTCVRAVEELTSAAERSVISDAMISIRTSAEQACRYAPKDGAGIALDPADWS